MALEVPWYDFLCFAIVAGAIVGSLWLILSREGGGEHRDDGTVYESLLVVVAPTGDDDDGDGGGGGGGGSVLGIGHVGKAQLWMSCWAGLHPAWLLGLRLGATLTMIGVISWDMWSYDPSILLYYTEYGIFTPFYVINVGRNHHLY